MATITKRNNSYLITVSCGYDVTGRQIRKTMTYKPDGSMTAKQLEKEVQRQAVLFEEECAKGTVMHGNIKFIDFAAEWFRHKKNDLRPKTYARYESMLPRINAAIGHMRLDRIQPQHLLSFYENLAEGNIRLNVKYQSTIDLAAQLQKAKQSKAAFARACGLPVSTLTTAIKTGHCSKETAEKICRALSLPLSKAFKPLNKDKPLAQKTVLHHHRLISSILSTAVEWGVLFANPCDRTKPPRIDNKEPLYLDEVQAATLLDLLEHERTDYKTMIRLLLFTGLRRGELLGLKWEDVNFDLKVLHIFRTTQYLPGKGVYRDETKNATSNRVIKLSNTAVEDLRKYKVWQMEQQLKTGDQWHDTGYIFTAWDGTQFHPDTLTSWFSSFIKAHADALPHITVHSLRHTNATLQIAGGVPLTTVAKRLGHANTVTTSRIYAHAIKSADEAAAETLENLLTPHTHKTA